MIAWLAPAIAALFLYGLGQGLVKKYIGETSPARFCLYFVFAKAWVNLWFYFSHDHAGFMDPGARDFLLTGGLAYILEGTGWILYFESIVAGPITIVGTLSAAYPALTVLFARYFLGETLMPVQYFGVMLVILGSLGLAYAPPDPASKKTHKRWIPLAFSALLLWGAAQTLVKHAYTLPQANEVYLALVNTISGVLTLGVYGVWKGRQGSHSIGEWAKSFTPMAMMAGGDLAVIVATANGPVSIVTPLTGAYPVVTLAFASIALKEKITKLQWLCLGLILFGIFFAPGGG